MSAFDVAMAVEAQSRAILLPWLEESSGGRYVLTHKGQLARVFQERYGDLLFNAKDGRLWTVELKAERKHTGNLFLETWSNRNLHNPASHAERGSNVGWLYKLQADVLLYHFLDTDTLYILSVFKLKRWAFVPTPQCPQGQIFTFPEHQQQKYTQFNDTHGRLVPVEALKKAGLVKVFHPKQHDMFLDGRSAA